MVAQSTSNATLTTIAAALRIQLASEGDQAGQRAVDRAVEHLSSGLPYDFDGSELRVTSASRRQLGMIQVSDGNACTCESAKRTWCWHRAAYRLLLAEWALREPAYLRAKILEQCAGADAGDWPPDSIFDDTYFDAA